MCSVEHEQVNGLLTEYVNISSTEIRPKLLQIFFVPGNPGTIAFYLDFFDLLVKEVTCACGPGGWGVELWACGHAGHDLVQASNRSTHGLCTQIQHKVCFFEKHFKPGAKVCLMGHSIGAYIVVDALRSLKPAFRESIAYLTLLMPFMWFRNMPAVHAMKLNAFALGHPVTSTIAGVCAQAVPRVVWDTSTRLLLPAKHAHLVAAVLALVVPNFLHMGVDELREIGAERRVLSELLPAMRELELLPGYKSTLCLYTEDDAWAPVEDSLLMEREGKLGKLDVSVVPSLEHAFSLKDDMSAAVVGPIVRQVAVNPLSKL
jgi:hypothetical protein